MKIIGGQARGRSLHRLPHNPGIRPILARIKKSLFDILRPSLSDCRFLDLYAGTGAVGLEALSRGAATATFVEKEEFCLNLIRMNLENLGFSDKADVIRGNSMGDLSGLSKPFDIIFMGPPYKDALKNELALVSPTLENIRRYGLLAPTGLVVAQHHKKEIVTPATPWIVFREERYGDTLVTFLRITM